MLLKGIWRQSHWNWKNGFFWDFGKKIFFSDHFFRFFYYKFENLYIDESWKKIQILLVKIKGISDARHQKRQKCEKIKQKGEHFSNTLPEWFSHISYFSYVANVSYNQRKIWYVQKNCNLEPGKMFTFFMLKNDKNAILLPFTVIFHQEYKCFLVCTLQDSKDLLKRFLKYPLLLFFGLQHCDW